MKNQLKQMTILVLAAALGGVAGVSMYARMHPMEQETRKEPAAPSKNFQLVNYKPGPEAVTDFTIAAEKTVPAVVHVKTTYAMNTPSGLFFDPFRDFFYGNPRQQQAPQSAGSGVIVTDDGYIVTNNHVVDNAQKVEVTLDDKRTFEAKVIGKDPSTDLALLKIEERNLPYLPYSNSDEVKVGQWALAVGNPFNLTSTVTAGIVSAKARNIHILEGNSFPIESFIQTDAAVNPGNSGGALVNLEGELIGINAAIASNTGSYTGYSFAIPVNIVKKVIDDIMEYGMVQRGFIGVNIQDIDQDLAKQKDIRTLNGVYVRNTTIGGAAETAGIREGDVITKVGNVNVKTTSELQEQVGRYRPGDKVQLTLLRGNTEKTVEVTLRNKQGTTRLMKDEIVSLLGAEFGQPSEDELQKLGINSGVKITKLGSGKLRSAGIRDGFIITKIDSREIASASELQDILQSKRGGVLIEGIYPNGMRAYYAFGL